MDGITNWFGSLFDGSMAAGGIFFIIGAVGVVLLIISVLLDGVFDLFDFGDGPLSLTTIAAFTTIFGFTAFASIGSGATPTAAVVIGAIAGVIGGAIAWWLSRVIRKAESTTAVTASELVGSEAAVVLAIPAGGLGEVALVRHGERVSLAATADRAIARGVQVRIVQTLTSTSVLVEQLPVAAPDSGAPDDAAPLA